MGLVEELIHAFKGKKVLLTGHTGFKGSWLLLLLNELGATVKGYSLAPETKSLYLQTKSDALCDSVLHDIRDRERVKQEVVSFNPDFIFHLAAQAVVRTSYECPVETFETNILGTVHILEALRQLPGKCVAVMVTTDKVYENHELNVPFVEGNPLGGHDPYSASKAAVEILISSYRESYFRDDRFDQHQKSVSSARAGNVVGGGDWSKDRLIPDIIRALTSSQEIIIRNPKAIRPWQHVLEPLLGYLILGMRQAIEPRRYNEAWNFGPKDGHDRSVEEVVGEVIRLWGSGQLRIVPDRNKPEAQFLKLSIEKASLIGWHPILTLEDTLKWTVDWYQRVEVKNENAGVVQREQLANYLKLLP